MNKLKVGIASFAHIHAYSYASVLKAMNNAEIKGFCDMNKERSAKVRQLYNIKQYKSCDDLIQDPDIDVILITTENKYHSEIAIKAMENNKHVFVEKPIAVSLEDAQAMVDASRKHGMKLIQCYPCRYHPSAINAKKVIDSGKIGEITSITATNHGCMPDHDDPETRWFSIKDLAGGGAVMDHTTHAADLIFWLTGWIPDKVFGTAKTLFHDNIDVDDAGMVLIKFLNGRSASIDPSWNRPVAFPTWGDLTMIIYGSEMTIKIDMFNQNIDVHSNKNSKSTVWAPFGANIDKNMLKEYVSTILDDRDPPVTGNDGIKALKVALKAYESSETKTFTSW
ncbi:MAG: Gfo/Idh/MocA family protein [Promethearchaeota archaeon]